MNKAIYEYELPVRSDVQIKMPEFATILGIGMVGDPHTLVIWAEADTKNAIITRFFQLRGTGDRLGHLIEVDGRYVGTVNLFAQGIPKVWHVYEVKP